MLFRSGPDPTSALCIYDNDVKPTPMISMIGSVAAGARVYVIFVPPQGNYIVGIVQAAVSVRNFLQTIFTTTSTVYTTGTAPQLLGVAFLAPASGRVNVHWVCELNHGTSFLVVSPQVATGNTIGSGTVHTAVGGVSWAANDDRTCRVDSASVSRYGSVDLCDGLTPGAAYNVALYHRVGGGTGTIGRRTVVVNPVP